MVQIGYFEYLKKKIPNPERIFQKNTRFIYKEWDTTSPEMVEELGWEKPYPQASLALKLDLGERYKEVKK